MAIFNEMEAQRFARALQKLFSIKGSAPTRQLAGEITPTIETDNLLALENRVLLSYRSFAYRHFVAAGGAGTFSMIRLRNPLGSGGLAVVEKATFSDEAATSQDVSILGGPVSASVDLTNVDSANTAIRDARLGATSGAMITSFGTPAVAGGGATRTLWTGRFSANQSVDAILYENEEIVLAPGDSYTFAALGANLGVTFSIQWRERTIEDSEVGGLA